jgi:hypothetical protein
MSRPSPPPGSNPPWVKLNKLAFDQRVSSGRTRYKSALLFKWDSIANLRDSGTHFSAAEYVEFIAMFEFKFKFRDEWEFSG